MSTFLELCQDVARESEVVSGLAPTTVVNQTGDLLKIVSRTREAWRDIQISQNRVVAENGGWRFLRKAFPTTATLIVDQVRYAPTSLDIDDHGEWIDGARITIWDPDIGVADQGPLTFLDWPSFMRLYLEGTQTSDKPVHWSISDDGELCVGPMPNKAYPIRGLYRRMAQVLTENDDTPLCPADYHQVIVWKSIIKLVQADEAPRTVLEDATRNYLEILSALEASQLGRITVRSRPLA